MARGARTLRNLSDGRLLKLLGAAFGVSLISISLYGYATPTVYGSSGSPQGVLAKLPPLPLEEGCYSFSPASKAWQPIGCLTSAEVALIPRPIEGGSSAIDGLTAVNSNAVNWSHIVADTHQFSGEEDSCYGNNAYSVQDNTNFFTGNNHLRDWVQFVIQEDPNNQCFHSPQTVAGIWQIDTYHGTYNCKCLPWTYKALNSLWSGEIIGTTATGGNLQATFTVCNPSCISMGVSTGDYFGLAGKWNQVSGTILGFGAGKQAVFYSPTNSYTDVGIGAPGLTNAFTSYPVLTGESNTLNYYMVQSLGCTLGYCTMHTGSSD